MKLHFKTKNKKAFLNVGYGHCGSSIDLICDSPEPSILFEGTANTVVSCSLSLHNHTKGKISVHTTSWSTSKTFKKSKYNTMLFYIIFFLLLLSLTRVKQDGEAQCGFILKL